MSPILFNLFINVVNEIFDERFCHPATLCNIKLSNLLYADYLILISESRTGLQSCLNKLQAYWQKWKLTVNNKKTKVMLVEKIQSSAQIHRFSFKKEPLEICKLYPYLGTIITNNGNFKEFSKKFQTFKNSARVLGEQCTLCLVVLINMHQEI